MNNKIKHRLTQLSVDYHGFALLEVLVAFTILSVALVPLLHCFIVTGRINTDTIRFGTALTLAQGKLEEISASPYRTVTDQPWRDFGEDEATAGYAGYFYSVVVDEHSPLLKTVEVRVAYNDTNGNRKEIVLTRDKAGR